VFCYGFIVLGTPEAADKFLVKPMEFIVPLEAGSDGDVIVRPVMQKVFQFWAGPS